MFANQTCTYMWATGTSCVTSGHDHLNLTQKGTAWKSLLWESPLRFGKCLDCHVNEVPFLWIMNPLMAFERHDTRPRVEVPLWHLVATKLCRTRPPIAHHWFQFLAGSCSSRQVSIFKSCLGWCTPEASWTAWRLRLLSPVTVMWVRFHPLCALRCTTQKEKRLEVMEFFLQNFFAIKPVLLTSEGGWISGIQIKCCDCTLHGRHQHRPVLVRSCSGEYFCSLVNMTWISAHFPSKNKTDDFVFRFSMTRDFTESGAYWFWHQSGL